MARRLAVSTSARDAGICQRRACSARFSRTSRSIAASSGQAVGRALVLGRVGDVERAVERDVGDLQAGRGGDPRRRRASPAPPGRGDRAGDARERRAGPAAEERRVGPRASRRTGSPRAGVGPRLDRTEPGSATKVSAVSAPRARAFDSPSTTRDANVSANRSVPRPDIMPRSRSPPWECAGPGPPGTRRFSFLRISTERPENMTQRRSGKKTQKTKEKGQRKSGAPDRRENVGYGPFFVLTSFYHRLLRLTIS